MGVGRYKAGMYAQLRSDIYIQIFAHVYVVKTYYTGRQSLHIID